MLCVGEGDEKMVEKGIEFIILLKWIKNEWIVFCLLYLKLLNNI